MARSITPERQELRAEAIQLRKAGWSQPEISKALAVPQKTLSNWLIVANSEANDTQPLSIVAKNSSIIISHNNHRPIALFPCKYEEVGDGIAPGSIDLILTDHLPRFSELKNGVNDLLKRGFGVNTIAEKLGWTICQVDLGLRAGYN